MVEKRPLFKLFCHLTLILGIASVAFPVWLAIVATTHSNGEFATGTPLWFGDLGLDVFKALFYSHDKVNGSKFPLALMLTNSLIMALCITVGKLVISI